MTNRTGQIESTGSLLRPAEAASISGLTTTQLSRMADAGKLSCARPGGTHRRYVRAEIEALAKPQRIEANR